MTKPVKKIDVPRADIYQRITAAIVAQLEKGVRPWMQPWGARQSPIRPLRHNGVAYRGINTVLLWMTATERGFQSPYWMTYGQAQSLGWAGAQVGKVRSCGLCRCHRDARGKGGRR